MSFSLFQFDDRIDAIVSSTTDPYQKLDDLAKLLGPSAFPEYLLRYIRQTTGSGSSLIGIHPSTDISTYTDAEGLDKDQVTRKRGFFGSSQRKRFPNAVHHLLVFHNGGQNARLFYKFEGSIQFIKNMAHDR